MWLGIAQHKCLMLNVPNQCQDDGIYRMEERIGHISFPSSA